MKKRVNTLISQNDVMMMIQSAVICSVFTMFIVHYLSMNICYIGIKLDTSIVTCLTGKCAKTELIVYPEFENESFINTLVD